MIGCVWYGLSGCDWDLLGRERDVSLCLWMGRAVIMVINNCGQDEDASPSWSFVDNHKLFLTEFCIYAQTSDKITPKGK